MKSQFTCSTNGNDSNFRGKSRIVWRRRWSCYGTKRIVTFSLFWDENDEKNIVNEKKIPFFGGSALLVDPWLPSLSIDLDSVSVAWGDRCLARTSFRAYQKRSFMQLTEKSLPTLHRKMLYWSGHSRDEINGSLNSIPSMYVDRSPLSLPY